MMMSKFPLPTITNIQAANEELGFEIPEEYAKFLLTFNGGQPEKRIFNQNQKKGAFPEFIIKYFLGIDINQEKRLLDLYSQYIDVIGEMPHGLLPIAYD